jgi:diguanylate cyclase (GGDEF)-like protein/PAS domain S-box-containing protein
MNRGLAAFIFVSSAGIALSAIEPERELYTAAQIKAEDDISNFSRLFLKDAEETFNSADLAVVFVRYVLESVGDKPHALEVIERMRQSAEMASSIREVSIFDEDGAWQAGFSDSEEMPSSIANSPVFQYHNANLDRGLQIGRPIYLDHSRRWVIPISRRTDSKNGLFSGVVLAHVDAKQISEFYKSTSGGAGIAVSLFRKGGTLLSRYPFVPDALGANFRFPPATEEEVGSRDSFSFKFQSTVSGEILVASIRRSAIIPLSIVVTQPEANIIKAWKDSAIYRIAFRIAASLAVGLLGFAILSQIRRRQRVADMLLKREMEFRVLAEGSGDAVFRTRLNGVILYASPAAARITSREVASLQGMPLADLSEPGDATRLAEVLNGVASGVTNEGRVSFAIAGEGGDVKHVTASVRLAQTEQESNLIVVVRDDTEGYLLERKLESLAATDSLTGLANRRVFSERLDQEWMRAARDRKPVSLLFVDGDRFKEFNDTYGHQVGDQCIRIIADTLNRVAKRSSDLAARYGGEEFVLLLPNTDGAAAQSIAEYVRSAIESLAIPHEQNGRVGVVTVSIGVATFWPNGDNAQSSEQLITRADQALYAAKASGRNCVRTNSDIFDPADIEWGSDPA